MATQNVPEAGEKFIPALESEVVSKKIASQSKLRSLKPLTIKKVFHQTAVPEGAAPTWCIQVKESDACYDAAWSSKAKAWVYGGANSGIKGG